MLPLKTFFHELNEKHFSGELPLPLLKWNYRLRSTAGMFMPGKRKSKSPHKDCVIEVAAYLKEVAEGEKHIRDTILHEMIHYWLWYRERPFGHTKEFYEKMRRTGAKRYNPVPKGPSRTYLYACPHCHREITAHRKLTNMACARCSEKYNQGFFHSSFALKLRKELPSSKVTTPKTCSLKESPREDILPLEKAMEQIAHIRKTLIKSTAFPIKKEREEQAP